MDDLIKRAKTFAIQAHRNILQVRKHTGHPYEVHLKAVAQLVKEVEGDDGMIAAAWLHDVVEDTPTTLDEVEQAFGPDVAALVADLTDVSHPSDGNRAARVALNRVHSAQASSRAKTIKLADLIDNARDICKHDPKFAPVFLAEMAALLEVLKEGDPELLHRARRTLATGTERLGLGTAPNEVMAEDSSPTALRSLRENQAFRSFARAFTAQDLAEPLRWFDEGQAASAVQTVLAREDLAVAGLVREGQIEGYLRAEGMVEGLCGASAVVFRPDQVVDGGTSLTEVVEVLVRHDFCFTTHLGRVTGVIRRQDIQKPVARMWLFGIITVTEADLARRIQETWPDGSWSALLSPGRLARCQQLRAQRRSMGQACSLLDCLQLSDKGEILLQNPAQLAAFGFSARTVGKQVLREVESLRNNLAHAQDIITHDWVQIVRFARTLEAMA
jgi:hypothetical protein